MMSGKINNAYSSRLSPDTLLLATDGAVVLTVTVAVTGPFTLIEAGTEHVERGGVPAQLSDTNWLKPPLGVRSRLYVAVWPGAMLRELGLVVLKEKSAPIPVASTVCGLFGALSDIESWAARVPPAVGAKVMLMVQLPRAGMLVPHVFVWVKSVVFPLAKEIPDMVKDADPWFVNVTDCAGEFAPIVIVGENVKEDVERLAMGAPTPPVILRIRALEVSAIHKLPLGSTANPCGKLRHACLGASPSPQNPRMLPAIVTMNPVPVRTSRITLLLVSAIKIFPAVSPVI
jgi:hypothetical protein